MRLGKTAWLILGIGIFVIALGSLFVGYSRLSDEQKQVDDSLSSAQELLPQLVAEREDSASQLAQLENQLAQAALSLSDSKAKFPQAVESIEYGEELFMIAHDCDLEIWNLTALEPTDLEVENVSYTITLFKVEVRATAPPPYTKAYIDNTIAHMLTFINTIATEEYFNVADIELVDIVAPKPEDKTTTWTELSATITLTVYTYQGE